MRTETGLEDFNVDHGRAVMMLNRYCLVMMKNSAAEQICAAEDGLKLISSQLHAIRASDDVKLQSLVTAVIDGARPAGGLSLLRPSGAVPYTILVIPFHGQKMSFISETRAALVIIADPLRRHSPSAQILQEVYDFTAKEAELAAQLTACATLDGAARKLGISLNTARTHLKNIFRKSGVNRQAELVALLSQLIP